MATNWNLPTYTPTSLNQYASCPESFLHDRVLKTPTTVGKSNASLLKGTATHALINHYIGLDAEARTRFADNLTMEATRELASLGMLDARSYGADLVAEIVEWTATGIDVLQTEFADAQVLVGEQFLDFPRANDPVPFRLTAKIDLLAVFPDGSVESLDWKTGSGRSLNQLQNVICRLVTEANVSRLVGAHLPGGRPTAIRTTVCHLGTRTLTSQQFDKSQLIAEFSEIRRRIERIERAKANPSPGLPDWQPQPGVLCRWCRYVSACSYYSDASGDDDMAWLDSPDPDPKPVTDRGGSQRLQLKLNLI